MTTLPKTPLRVLFRLTPRPLRHFLRDRLLPGPLARRIRDTVAAPAPVRDDRRAHALEAKLWGGFSEQALADLEALKLHPATGAADVSYAAWALARWHYAHGAIARARDEIALMRLADRGHPHKVAQPLLEAACLMALDRPGEARAVLDHVRQGREDNPHLALAMANTYTRPDGAQDAARLAWINRVLQAEGLAPLARRDVAAPLGLDNLVAAPVCGLTPPERQPRVSVLVPAHAAEASLHLALDSLLAQSWRNLEIIVVDDCSADGTFALAQRYAAQDGRVTALRQGANRGAYAARNLALEHATGDLITVHDADDWSHPLKIEIQARHLMETPGALANVTSWVRSTPDMIFRGTARPTGNMVQLNHSALMLRRATLQAMGGWDEVRAGGDSELIRRLEHAHGAQAVHSLIEGAPLSLALEEASSLTRRGPTHVHTLFHGVRREYHEASRHWLAGQPPGEVPRAPSVGDTRAFPAPAALHPEGAARHRLDLLVISDFNIEGGAYRSTMAYVEAALAMGLSVGLFHWRRYDLDVTRPLRPELRQMAQEGRLRIVTPGEAVTARTVITGYPPVLQHAIDLPPRIDCACFAIVTNQMAARLYSGGDVQYDPARVEANVERLFGVAPLWVPISGLVRRLMEADGRYTRIHDDIWTPLIDPAHWDGGTRRRLPDATRQPVVGRHGRDHYTKWPQDAETIRAAYCAGRPCELRILGGDDHARALLGTRPCNWQVEPFGARSAQEFLAGLDVFLHYPHEDYIEEFGRAVIEAMAAGVPVILPEVFRPTFGAAALYAPPADVWPTVARLWADADAYAARVEAGREFVMQTCRPEHFAQRLERLQRG